MVAASPASKTGALSPEELRKTTGELLLTISTILTTWEKRKDRGGDESASKISEHPEIPGFVEILAQLTEAIPQQPAPLSEKARKILVLLVKAIPSADNIVKKFEMEMEKFKGMLNLFGDLIEKKM